MEVSGRLFTRVAAQGLLLVAATSVALALAASKAASQGGGKSKVPDVAPKPPAGATRGPQAPQFTVDMFWPKPLPTHQPMGSAVGVATDVQDHVFVVHKIDSFTARTEIGATATPPIGECCLSAPPVLEFDAAGKLVNAWGGPGTGYDWPSVPAGIAVDPKGNVWIAGSGGLDGQVLVFTHDGKFIRQIGKAGTAIDFQAIDGRPVTLIWLLTSPPDKTGPHIHALARISRLMTIDKFRQSLNVAKTSQEIFDLIIKQEETL